MYPRVSTFNQNFPGKKRVFLAVIHLRDDNREEHEKNIRAAVQGGADGILLINQALESTYEHIMSAALLANQMYPDLWIGINHLADLPGVPNPKKIPAYIKGIWSDESWCDEKLPADQQEFPHKILNYLYEWPGCYFAGVAFKTQPTPVRLSHAVKAAIGNMDVITTSGPGTGMPAEIHKIASIRSHIGYAPMALASGVNVSNINEYLPYVDCFIIGTGIENEVYDVSEEKVRAIRTKIDEWLSNNGLIPNEGSEEGKQYEGSARR